jgi:hypothetical protein|tara:strand:+ start:381 stop:485 length:105 start_codon:yes stop_codon:yes gene_type:complete
LGLIEKQSLLEKKDYEEKMEFADLANKIREELNV